VLDGAPIRFSLDHYGLNGQPWNIAHVNVIASRSEVLAMRPFDLPDNVFDLMSVDRCRPAEVCEREAYLSNPADEDTPHPPHVDPPAVPTLPSPPPDAPPSRRLMDDDRAWLRWHERDQEAVYAAIGESLRHRRSARAALASG
jgi:hypothetical protein